MTTPPKKIKIEFQIHNIDKIEYHEIDFNEYGLTSNDIKNSKFKFGIHLKFNEDEETIAQNIKVIAYYPSGKKELELYGIEAVFQYKIKNFLKIFKHDIDNTYNIPDPFMAMLLGISISGTRGMLVSLNQTTEYKNIILPLFDPKRIIKDYRKWRKSKDQS